MHTDVTKNGQAARRAGLRLDRPLRPRRHCCATASSRGCSAPTRTYADGAAASTRIAAWDVADDERKARRPWRAMRARSACSMRRCGISPPSSADEPLWSICWRGTTGARATAQRSRSMRAAAIIDASQRYRRPLRRRAPGDRPGPSPLQDQDRRRSAERRSAADRGGPCCARARHEPRRRRQRHVRSRADAVEYLEALAAYPLAWIEEPVHPLDFDLHRDIAGRFGAAAGDRRKSVFRGRRAQSAALRRPAQRSRRPAVRHLA